MLLSNALEVGEDLKATKCRQATELGSMAGNMMVNKVGTFISVLVRGDERKRIMGQLRPKVERGKD